MLSLDSIISTILFEHNHDNSDLSRPETCSDDDLTSTPSFAQLLKSVKDQLAHPQSIPYYSHSSSPFSLVRFRCLMQDTSYPAEVYQPGPLDQTPQSQNHWSNLKERWVGWGIEIPGEQAWARKSESKDQDVAKTLQSLIVQSSTVPIAPKAKWTLPEGQDTYLGALIKIYDDVQLKPASAFEIIGILSNAPFPVSFTENENLIVSAIHVVTEPKSIYSIQSSSAAPESEKVRNSLLGYLSKAFCPPDFTAAEILLLALLATPISRPHSMPPIGTLAVNFLRPSGQSVDPLLAYIRSIAPFVLSIPLSIDLLHKHPFRPSAVDSSLNAGLLQMAPGTVVLVEEDHMGNGGQLSEKAFKNLQALKECISQQRVPYDYPFMDELKMDCEVRPLIVSESKSLLPVDLHVSVNLSSSVTTVSQGELEQFREYLATHSSPKSASKISISEEVGEQIQLSFVADRRSSAGEGSEAAESRLKSRMQLARLIALSHSGDLTMEIWNAAVSLYDQATSRTQS